MFVRLCNRGFDKNRSIELTFTYSNNNIGIYLILNRQYTQHVNYLI